MTKYLIIAVVFLCGCMAINKSLKVKVECENCQTPYGSGEKINLSVERIINAV